MELQSKEALLSLWGVEQEYVVIEDANPPSEIRRVVVPSMHQEIMKQPIAQPTILPLVPINQEGTMVERAEPAPERSKPERTNAMVTEAKAVVAVLNLKLHLLPLQCPIQP